MIVLKTFPVHGNGNMRCQGKGDVSQRRIFKCLLVGGNDTVEKMKLMSEMRESMITEVIMKGNQVCYTNRLERKVLKIHPSEQIRS